MLEDQKSKDAERKRKTFLYSPYSIIGLKPIQIPNLNVDSIIELRKEFTLDEWIVLVLRSVGNVKQLMSDFYDCKPATHIDIKDQINQIHLCIVELNNITDSCDNWSQQDLEIAAGEIRRVKNKISL